MEPTNGDDNLNGGPGDDTIDALGGNDTVTGGTGNDTIDAGAGNDRVNQNVTTDGADSVNTGSGSDLVSITADAPTNVRLTFTSSEVGNGAANDSGTLANQDGGLAVRLQAETAGVPSGPLSRYDDEGVTFVGGSGVTFDVRDLVSGVGRGQAFEVVTLGTSSGDTLTAVAEARPYYFNGGQGADTISGGSSNDFLVGGAGDDVLTDDAGNDSAIGGGGNDTISLGAGDDVISAFNVTTDGVDSVNTGSGLDLVNVSSATPTNVRLTFTSAEVGNGAANDAGTMLNQDGGLAVRLQAEDGDGKLTGGVSRFDDEGVAFVAAPGTTFDVRDLVSGAARGEAFQVVALGTNTADTLFAVLPTASYYFNGGQGADSISGGSANDFLVGGAGDDVLTDEAGNDSAIGGGGADTINLGAGDDRIAAFNITTDGADSVNLGSGSDVVSVTASSPTNVRITFTSAEVGNGSANDAGTMLNQDGGLAVRLQAESAGTPGGAVSRFDDEGITFVGGPGVTFDVRDLVSGAARGEGFQVVQLGTSADDSIEVVDRRSSYYVNAGGGNDSVEGGVAADFLVGGAGADTLLGVAGDDSMLGGGGDDRLAGMADDDSLDGGDGVDRVFGNIGDDTLLGGAGNDVLTGGDGADRLIGGAGSDALWASNDDDQDVFVYLLASDSAVATRDRLIQFDSGEDRVDLTALGITDLDAQSMFAVRGGSTIVSFDLDGDGRFDDFALKFVDEVVTEADFIV